MPRARRRAQDGFTLVEIVIAMLLIAAMTGPMMMIALSGRVSMGRTDRRAQAAGAVRRVSEALKPYVTADTTLASGPGIGGDGWKLPGDSSGLHALGAGHHDLSSAQWAPDLSSYGAAISYDVTLRDTPSGPQPDVTFTVGWNEP